MENPEKKSFRIALTQIKDCYKKSNMFNIFHRLFLLLLLKFSKISKNLSNQAHTGF